MAHYIKHVQDHVEIYDECNRFILSADSENEALHEIGLMLAEQYRNKTLKEHL